MSEQFSKLTYAQRTFGSKYEVPVNKMKVIVTNPSGTLTFTPFDDLPDRLKLVISLFPDMLPKNSLRVYKAIKIVYAQHGDCPEGENFWVWYTTVRNGRVTTIAHEFDVMFRYLQQSGYYSK